MKETLCSQEPTYKMWYDYWIEVIIAKVGSRLYTKWFNLLFHSYNYTVAADKLQILFVCSRLTSLIIMIFYLLQV